MGFWRFCSAALNPLNDLLGAYRMDVLDEAETVDIWWGIPQDPKPPRLQDRVWMSVSAASAGDGEGHRGGGPREVEHYTLGESIRFEGMDRPLECFYDGFPETLHGL